MKNFNKQIIGDNNIQHEGRHQYFLTNTLADGRVCLYISKDNFDQLQRYNVVSTLIHLETFNIQDARGCIHTSPCMKLYTETFRFQKKHPEAVCSLFSSINNTHFPSLLCFRAEHRLVVYEFKSCSRFTFTLNFHYLMLLREY